METWKSIQILQIVHEYQTGIISIAQTLGMISSDKPSSEEIQQICPLSLLLQQPGVFQQIERKPNALEELPWS